MVLTTCFMLMPVEIYQDSWTIKKVEMELLNRPMRGWGRQNLSSFFSPLSLLFFDFFFSSWSITLVRLFLPSWKPFFFFYFGLSSASPLSSNWRFLSLLLPDVFPSLCESTLPPLQVICSASVVNDRVFAMSGTLRSSSLIFSSYRWSWKAQEELTYLLKSPR